MPGDSAISPEPDCSLVIPVYKPMKSSSIVAHFPNIDGLPYRIAICR
jgi:hypothetical protein